MFCNDFYILYHITITINIIKSIKAKILTKLKKTSCRQQISIQNFTVNDLHGPPLQTIH